MLTTNIPIIKTNEPQVCVLPGLPAMKVRKFLEKQNIECKVVGRDNFEDGWPASCTYLGKTYTQKIRGVIACVDNKNLHAIAEDLHGKFYDESDD